MACHQTPADDDYGVLASTSGSGAPVGYSKSGITAAALSTWGTSLSNTLSAPRIIARLTSTV